MKDFANVKRNKSKKTKRKTVFTSKKPSVRTISASAILILIFIGVGLAFSSIFLFKTNVISIKNVNTSNTVNIDFPSSLMENSVLIEFNEENNSLECQFFVNRKYALEAIKMLNSDIESLSINEVYSTLLPGKLLNSVISGPYINRSAANNAKEKITKRGFEPRLRTVCKEN